MQAQERIPQEAFRRAAYAYANNKELAERIYEYASKGWFMFSSPILSNADSTGMPISCFLSYVDDSIEGLVEHCLLYTSPSPRDVEESRMPSSA